jgi:transcriptional regulator of aromatic amino acid metabolism
MQDNIRIEKERKYWDKIAPEYEHSVIEKYWKVYPSLRDKISKDILGLEILSWKLLLALVWLH